MFNCKTQCVRLKFCDLGKIALGRGFMKHTSLIYQMRPLFFIYAGLMFALVILSGCNPVQFDEQTLELSSLDVASQSLEVPIAEPPKDCLLAGKIVKHDESIVAFLNNTVAYNKNCNSTDNKEIRQCKDGILSGSFTQLSCKADKAKSCEFNGQTLAHNQSVTAFLNSSVPYNALCDTPQNKESRLCINGELSGSFQNPNCSIEIAKNCTFNGKTIDHGTSVAAYLKKLLPYDGNCEGTDNKEMRSCVNGNLSGTFLEASCKLEEQKIGVLDPNWKTDSYRLPTASHLIIQPDDSLLLVGNDSLMAGISSCAAAPGQSCYNSMTAFKFDIIDGHKSTNATPYFFSQKAAKYYQSTAGGLSISASDYYTNKGMVTQTIIRNAQSLTFFGAFADGAITWGAQIQKSEFDFNGKPVGSSSLTKYYPNLGGMTFNGTSFSDLDLLPSNLGFLTMSGNGVQKYLFSNGGYLDPNFGTKGSINISLNYNSARSIDVKTFADDDSFITVISSTITKYHDTFAVLKFNNLGKLEQKSASWTLPAEYNAPNGGGINYKGSLIQKDGSVLLIFSANKKEASGNQVAGYAVVKFNSSGALDKTFGDKKGLAWIPMSNPKFSMPYYKPHQVRFIQQSNGQIYLVSYGTLDSNQNSGSIVVRMNVDGTLDSKYFAPVGQSGILRIPSLYVPDRSFNVKVEDAGLALSSDEKYLYIAFTTVTRRVVLK